MLNFLIFYYIFSFLFLLGINVGEGGEEKSVKEVILTCIIGFILLPIFIGTYMVLLANSIVDLKDNLRDIHHDISYLNKNVKKVEHELIKDQLVKEIIKELTKKYNYNDEK